MNLGLVGATGLVGQRFLKLLADFDGKIQELRLFSRSQKPCVFKGKTYQTLPLKAGCFAGLDICFFSAGGEVSRQWAPQAEKEGVIVIDNSSVFRRDKDKLLVVPEINGNLLAYKPQIISNPNCSTIQLVMALYPLYQKFGLEEVRVVSLQSISGAGRQAVNTLKEESQDILNSQKPYETETMTHAFNCVPVIGALKDQGFCEEEEKIMYESQKIMQTPELKISAFTVRVPCLNSHSEVVWFSLKKKPDSVSEISSALSSFVEVREGQEFESLPHGRQASGKEGVFVGRIHPDRVSENSWIMWVVADNLLKGASLNGLQIAQKLWKLKNNKEGE